MYLSVGRCDQLCGKLSGHHQSQTAADLPDHVGHSVQIEQKAELECDRGYCLHPHSTAHGGNSHLRNCSVPCHVCSSLAGVLPGCLQLEVGVLGDGVESGSEEVGVVASLLTMGEQLGEATPLCCSCTFCYQQLQCCAHMLLHSALSGYTFRELVEAVLPVQRSW